MARALSQLCSLARRMTVSSAGLRISATKDTHMGKIVDRCVNQIRDMSIAELEANLPAQAVAVARSGDEDDVAMGGEAAKPKDVTLLGAIITKLSELIK